jgi:hypothetical protein
MNNLNGATGILAFFSEITKTTNDTATAQNIPMMGGESHANAWPPKLKDMTKKERVETSMAIPAKSSLARVARKPETCEGERGKRSVLTSMIVTT